MIHDPTDKYGFKKKLAVNTNFDTGGSYSGQLSQMQNQDYYANNLVDPMQAGKKPGQSIIDSFSANQDKTLAKSDEKVKKTLDNLDVGDTNTGNKFADIGMTALGEAPKLINMFSDKPKTGTEATGKVLQGTASGAKIGGSIVPGWGHAIGAVAGAGAGIVAGAGWKDELLAEEDKLAQQKLDDTKSERARNYYLNSSSAQLQSQLDLHKKINGYNS